MDHEKRTAVLAPVRWLGRAARGSGTERTAVSQAVKAALAAVVAWVVAADVFRLPQPFLAPWAAVFIVEATVVRSLRTAAQQVAAVLVAVLLAVAVDWVAPGKVLAVALAVLAGLLIGQWHRFGDSGPWIGITALLLITLGTADERVLLVDRLVETALGAAIGLTVNGLLFPPFYRDHARDTTRRLARDMADLLTEMATAFRRDEPPEDPSRWRRRVGDAARLVREAEDEFDVSRESRRMNVRRSAFAMGPPTDGWQRVLVALRESWRYLAELAGAAHTTTAAVPPFEYPDHPSRTAFADVLDRMATVVTLLGDGHKPGDTPFDDAATAAHEAMDTLTDQVERTPAFGAAAGLAGTLFPARHALHALTTH